MLGNQFRRYRQFYFIARIIIIMSFQTNTQNCQTNMTEEKQKDNSEQTPKRLIKSSSLSTNNSPRTNGSQAFQRDINFPTLQSLKSKKRSPNISFKEVQSVVKEECQQNEGKYHLRHFKLMSDHDEFNNTQTHRSRHKARGKSLGCLGKVEQTKEEEEQVGIRKRQRSRIGSMMDKNEFNKGQTGINVPDENTKAMAQSLRSEIINSITQIEQAKQGLTKCLTPRSSSLNLIVDEMDKPQKIRETNQSEIIESIEEQKVEEEKDQPLLRASIQKLHEQKQLMKKMIKSETVSADVAHLESENVSIIAEPIEQEHGEDSDKEQDQTAEVRKEGQANESENITTAAGFNQEEQISSNK